jgi:hypothetical protein
MMAAGMVASGWLRFVIPQQSHEPSAQTRRLAAAEPRPRQRRKHQVNTQSNTKHRINSRTDQEVEVRRGGITLPPIPHYRRQHDKKSTPSGSRTMSN